MQSAFQLSATMVNHRESACLSSNKHIKGELQSAFQPKWHIDNQRIAVMCVDS